MANAASKCLLLHTLGWFYFGQLLSANETDNQKKWRANKKTLRISNNCDTKSNSADNNNNNKEMIWNVAYSHKSFRISNASIGLWLIVLKCDRPKQNKEMCSMLEIPLNEFGFTLYILLLSKNARVCVFLSMYVSRYVEEFFFVVVLYCVFVKYSRLNWKTQHEIKKNWIVAI